MFDIKKIIEEAKSEVNEDRAKTAKGKIKAALKRIDDAETILKNAKDEYDVLLRDIGS